MCLYYDYHTSKSFPPFSPSKLSHIPLLATFEINDLFFHYCCYMHICMCTCISKYNLFNLHVFRAGHFLVDNQLVYSYLNKIISLIHRIPYFSVFFFCVGLRPCGPLAPIPFGIILMSSLFISYTGNHIDESFGVQLLKSLGDICSQLTHWSLSLVIFPPYFLQYFLRLGAWIVL